MTSHSTIRDLLRDAQTDIPPSFERPPVATLHKKIRRRRFFKRVGTGAAVVMIVAGSALTVNVLDGKPVPRHPASTDSPPNDGSFLHGFALTSAFAARDDRTITIYAAPDKECHDLDQAQAAVSARSAASVTISLHARSEQMSSCASQGTQAKGFAVELDQPLAGRALIDGSTGQVIPLVAERHLPVLTSDWQPYTSSWGGGGILWMRGYNGPHGTSMVFSAGRSGGQPLKGETIRLGSREGVLSGDSAPKVRWRVDHVLYAAWFMPAEGQSASLDEFKQLIESFSWP